MTVKRRKDTRVRSVFLKKIGDVPGGFSVATSELGGDYLHEGAVLSHPIDGISHVVKIAKVAADVAASATTITVDKGHNFKVGDFVTIKPGSAAYAITAIDTSTKETDTITVGTALGAISAGGFIVEAAKSGAASTLKYTPYALAGTGKHIEPNSNLDTDAVIFAITTNNELPDFVMSLIPTIVNY